MNRIFVVYVCVFFCAGFRGDGASEAKNIGIATQNIRNNTQLIHNRLSAIKKNLTALSRIKDQIHRIVDANVKSAGSGDKSRNGTKTSSGVPKTASLTKRTNERIKRRTQGKENLDNLYPTLSIRSVNVNMDWFSHAKSSNLSQIGTSFSLFDGKNLVAHIMNLGNYGNFYTISSLEQDRVYKGEIKIITDRSEIKNFIRKQSDKKNIEEFELTTPFIVSGEFYYETIFVH